MMEDKNGNLRLGYSSSNLKNGRDAGLWSYDGKSLKLFTTKDRLSPNHVLLHGSRERRKHLVRNKEYRLVSV